MVRARSSQRGQALLVVVGISAALLLMVAGLFLFGSSERTRAIQASRDPARMGCAQAGLELAKAYFTAHFSDGWASGATASWLADPTSYNPVPAQWQTSGYSVTNAGRTYTCATPCTAANPNGTALQGAHPELFFDLDGDSKYDVYIYIRDNEDEFPPSTNNWIADNDQNVIIGAVCISQTLAPRAIDGSVDAQRLSLEALLSYDTPANNYGGQLTQGSVGDGNLNNALAQ